MKLLDRVSNFLFNKLDGKSQNSQEFYLNDPDMMDYLVGKKEISEAIFSVISRLSNTFASLPLKMINDQYEQPIDSTAFNLLSDGPRYFTKFDFFRDIEALRNYKGNAYVQIFRNDNGEINDMALIRPDCCEPVIDADSGELYFRISAIDNQNYKKNMYVHYMEVLHFKHTRLGGLKGINPIQILEDTLSYDKEVQKISLKQLNGTTEGFKVKLATNMSEENKRAVIKNIAEFYQKNGGLLVEENGVEIERIKRELVDSKLMEIDKISKSKIAIVYTVPEHFVGGGQSSYSSQEQLNMEFLTYTLIPTVTQYENELNKKTLTPSQKKKGYKYKFNVAGLLRADTATRGAFYQIMRRNSAYSGNDVRMYEDLTPIDTQGMNDYHISGDLYPIDMDPAERKVPTIKM